MKNIFSIIALVVATAVIGCSSQAKDYVLKSDQWEIRSMTLVAPGVPSEIRKKIYESELHSLRTLTTDLGEKSATQFVDEQMAYNKRYILTHPTYQDQVLSPISTANAMRQLYHMIGQTQAIDGLSFTDVNINIEINDFFFDVNSGAENGIVYISDHPNAEIFFDKNSDAFEKLIKAPDVNVYWLSVTVSMTIHFDGTSDRQTNTSSALYVTAKDKNGVEHIVTYGAIF